MRTYHESSFVTAELLAPRGGATVRHAEVYHRRPARIHRWASPSWDVAPRRGMGDLRLPEGRRRPMRRTRRAALADLWRLQRSAHRSATGFESGCGVLVQIRLAAAVLPVSNARLVKRFASNRANVCSTSSLRQYRWLSGLESGRFLLASLSATERGSKNIRRRPSGSHRSRTIAS